MKVSTVNKQIYCLFFLLIIAIIFLINNFQLTDTNVNSLIIVFLLNLSLIILSWWINGFELITYILFCIILLTLPITIEFFTGNSYGLLSSNVIQLHYAKFLKYTFFYCYVFFGISEILNFSKKESKIVQLKFENFGNLNIIFNNLIAVLFAFVAFPRLSLSVSATERFNMLLPGHAWNQLAIVALLFNIRFLKNHISVQISYAFVVLWFLLNGERADVTGLILGIVIYFFMNGDIDKSRITGLKKVLLLLLLLLFILILNSIASWRNGNSISMIQSFENILVTPTISDVSYIFNTVIDYSEKFGKLNGQLFFDNLLSIIPLHNNVIFENIMTASYPYPGGEPWLAQPLLDWGTAGIFFSPLIDIILLKLICFKTNDFFKMEYLAFLCLIPRAIWYGRSYTFTTLLFFVPLMFGINRLLEKLNSI